LRERIKPKKLVPDLIGDGYRFSDKMMRKEDFEDNNA